jgi:hypothetical protein
VQSLAREFLSAAALWEKWPDRLDYVNGLYLHADMERHDAVAQAFLRSLEHGRTSLSDVRPECRSPQQEEALRLLNPALLKVLADREPVAQIMRHARDGMNALLGSRKNGLHDL